MFLGNGNIKKIIPSPFLPKMFFYDFPNLALVGVVLEEDKGLGNFFQHQKNSIKLCHQDRLDRGFCSRDILP